MAPAAPVTLAPRPEETAAASEPAAPPEVGASVAAVEPDTEPLVEQGVHRLFLVARDPHWLYAHWDLSEAELRRHEAAAAAGHLSLNLYLEAVRGEPFLYVQLTPQARAWFVHVGRGETTFVGELGYRDANRQWRVITTSAPATTPPEVRLAQTAALAPGPLAQLQPDEVVEAVRQTARREAAVQAVLAELRAQGHLALPPPERVPAPVWTPPQQAALAAVVRTDDAQRVWVGPLEVTPWLAGWVPVAATSVTAPQFSWPAPTGPTAPVLPAAGAGSLALALGPPPAPGAGQPQRAFWFNVNAELVVYGSTAPDAVVTIAGRPIRLRPDGSFSLRFAFPEGEHPLEAKAVSADDTDGRWVGFQFVRRTDFLGNVGVHPSDPQLKPPAAGAEGLAP